MSLLLLPLARVYVCFGLTLMLAFSMDARADAVLIRFRPPTNGSAAGYKVYSALETTGSIAGTPIDIGARAPDSTGVATYSLANLDPSRSYSVELTAYDSRGGESRRSNRITLAARTEMLGAALWQNGFSTYAPGVRVPGFSDYVGDSVRSATSTSLFAVSYFTDGKSVFGTAASPGAVATRYTGSTSATWDSYEISGRVLTFNARAQVGIAARATNSDFSRYFELGQDSAGQWQLRGRNEPALTCSRGPATGVTQPITKVVSFKFRTTRANNLSRVRAKVWVAGAAEPSSWQADCWTTVAASADSGYFGLLRGGSGAAYFDDLAVKPVLGTLDRIPG